MKRAPSKEAGAFFSFASLCEDRSALGRKLPYSLLSFP